LLQSLAVPETVLPPDPAGDVGADVSADVTVDVNPRIAKRLFILPAIIGSVVVLLLAVWFLFGALTREARSADSYLQDIKTAEGNRRWQAAYELSRLLDNGELKAQEGTAAQVLTVFESVRGSQDDPRVRRYLALTLGRLESAAAVPALSGALEDEDAETRIYAALSLGRIGDRGATKALAGALSDKDPAVRKSAAYALGALADPSGAEALREALHDQEVDVTWNAAVALARMNDPSGADVLRSMADREFVERASQSEDPATRSEVLVTAVLGIAMIEDKGAIPALEKLAGEDPDMRVRQAAIEALKKVRPAAG
jgi:HEAT repeat protein